MARQALDVYETPLAIALQCTKALSEYIYLPDYANIVEPSCGSGAFIKSCRSTWPASNIHGFDVRPIGIEVLQSGANKFTNQEWESNDFWNQYRDDEVDLIIGNPPYLAAQKHIELSIERVKEHGYVAMLLRLDFLGSQKRFDFWMKNRLRFLFPLSGRPRFTGKGTDMYEYGFFVWSKNSDKPSEIMPPMMVSNVRSRDIT